MKKFISIILLSLVCGCSPHTPSQFSQQFPPQGCGLSPLYLFQNTEEVQDIPLKIQGKIPDWLQGDFVRNGPGIVEAGNGRVKSWFDGLAKLHAFTFRPGYVTYTTQFLKSEAYKTYVETGDFDFVGFAQHPKTNKFSFIDFLFNIKNKEITNSNVNIAKINNQRIALTEIPLPVVFGKNLNTLGYFDYNDDFPKNYSFESAHPLQDPTTKATWNFFIKIGLFDATYQIYHIPPCTQERQVIASISRPSLSYMHSFSLAGRYVVLIDYPLRAKEPRAIADGFIEAFSWYGKECSIIYVIDKESGKLWTFTTDPFFSFHHINGFERDGKVYVDFIAYPTPDIIHNVNYYPFIKNPDNTLERLVLDLAHNTVTKQQLSPEHMEFPRLNEDWVGKNYQYFYAVHIQKKGNGIIKYHHLNSAHAYWFEEGAYANEPVFVPSPSARSEDDGVILTVINDLNKKTSFLLILDAKDLKELARVEAPHFIPFGFHGKFFAE